MSSLWTPGGEHPVDDGGRGPLPDESALDETALDDLGEDETEAALRAELDQARQRLASVPAAQVVANHAMGLFELAAIHLSRQPPHLDEASLAIDAMGALVDSTGARLGDSGPVLTNALAQIRMAFVQVKGQSAEA